ncbi:Protein ANTAGONIST OF LIKE HETEROCHROMATIN PROTEIN 1 [Anabarilius grahami]|uniref:Putative nuclease HARBI1 n=1 Tax=Anabarilius grahami TaxID=495550 RepID=A0A3N0XN43_ANAGA|nr:Protein ANTAGONIST OF LIKE HETEROCHROMATIN PROTEIN 1 [Anabarilius grahami]
MATIVHRYRRRRYHQRVHAERAKPLEQYTSEELYASFRFGRDDIKYIADLVRPTLQHQTQRSHALSVEEQCLIALCFYACGTFFQVIGDNMGVRKATVSNVVTAMSVALGSLINQFVSIPKDDQTAQTKHKFFQMGNMPCTIGAIDCTHMHIQAPFEREWEYVNRKGRHSITIQLVGNADLIITNCVVKWPGSVHDANTPEQARFNSSHCKTRCAIERLNGVLKRWFACLNVLREQPKVASNIILACIVLHNIATRRHVPLDDNFDGPEADVEPEQPPMFLPNEGHTGHAIRDAIVRNYF